MHFWSIDYVLGLTLLLPIPVSDRKEEQRGFVRKSLQVVLFPFSSHLLQSNIERGELSLELLVRTGLAVEGCHA